MGGEGRGLLGSLREEGSGEQGVESGSGSGRLEGWRW